MTNEQLIKLLSIFPKDAEVEVNGYSKIFVGSEDGAKVVIKAEPVSYPSYPYITPKKLTPGGGDVDVYHTNKTTASGSL